MAPYIQRLTCNNWISRSTACLGIACSGGGLCEDSPWWNYCADPRNERVQNTLGSSLIWTASYCEGLDGVATKNGSPTIWERWSESLKALVEATTTCC